MAKKTAPEKPATDRPIERSEIEGRLRSLQGDFDSVKQSAAGAGLAAGLGIALLLIALAFIIGRKRGQAKYAFVEIRRA